MMSKTVDGYPYEEFIYCGCNCGFTRPKYCIEKNVRIRKDRPAKYIKGHSTRGINIKPIENLSYSSIHIKMNKIYPKKEFCEECGLIPPLDLANITGIYNLEMVNWRRMCRLCHNNYDRIHSKGWITKKRNGFVMKRDKKTGRFI